MGEYNRACLDNSSGDIVMLVNDDIVIRTPGWDDAIRAIHESVGDGVYLAYPNDQFKGQRVCTFPILSRRTCELLGDPFPAEYKGAFIDYHLLDVFQRLRRQKVDRIFYLHEVVFEHMHYRLGKSAFDETYRKRSRFGDDAAFLQLAAKRRHAAKKLLAAVSRGELPGPPQGAFREVVSRFSTLNASLLDSGLPWQWKFRLFTWFLARKAFACTSDWIGTSVDGPGVHRH